MSNEYVHCACAYRMREVQLEHIYAVYGITTKMTAMRIMCIVYADFQLEKFLLMHFAQ